MIFYEFEVVVFLQNSVDLGEVKFLKQIQNNFLMQITSSFQSFKVENSSEH